YVTRQSPLPGPFPLPYIGNALQILYMNFKEGNYQFDLGEYARMQVEKYGHISEVYQGSTRVIYLSKAEYLEKVYVPNSNSNYFARPDINGVSEVNAVHGLFFNNDFKSWKRIRKFVSQSLMSPRFIREFTSTIQQ
ncbi:4282_t:CDS:1, partial [Funneliformis caledonium]